MPEYAWPISAVIAWVIFLMLVDWSRLKYTIWGGLITAAVQLMVDAEAISLNLYHVNSLLPLYGSSPFFTFGVVLTVGILFAQTLPASRWLQGLSILVITLLFSLEELLFVKAGALEYLAWNRPASIFINLLVLTSYAWLIDTLGLNRLGRMGAEVFRL